LPDLQIIFGSGRCMTIALPPLATIGAVGLGERRITRREPAANKLPPQQNGRKNSRPFSTEDARRVSRRRYQHGQLLLIGESWFGRFYIDEIVDGNLRRYRPQKFLGTLRDYPTKRLAQRALEQQLRSVNNLNSRPRPTATFAEFAGKWEVSVLRQLKPSTEQNYRVHLRKHLVPFFGPQQLKDVDPESVQRFVASIKASPKTTRNIVVTLKSLWRSARAWGYVSHDIFAGVVCPRSRRPQRYFFSPEDVRRIVCVAKEPHRTFYGLLAETGLRVGELCGLTVDDVDLDRGLLVVRQSAWRGKLVGPKTVNSVRVVNLSPQCVDRLRQFLKTWRPNENGLLFASRNGTPWDGNMQRKRRFRSVLKKLNIQVPKGNGFHAFRHANAVLMDRLGVPMKVRQQRLGHGDATVTLGIYTHAVGEDSLKAASELGRLVWTETAGDSATDCAK
jgi:integrase